ncbi:MAG TPA: sigma-70 family RNA polymerase sigma factor [Planctomycetaceae bacterium]|nr:sigma-70 family RNA polymerase sigma factor [Planctomycetaceae bacterium]
MTDSLERCDNGGRDAVPRGSPSSPSVADSLAELLRRHGGKVAGHLRRRFPGLSEEERYDVLVDALLLFTRLYDANRGPAGPFLLLLAHHRAIDFLRTEPQRRPGSASWLEEVPSVDGPPERRLEQRERVEEIHEAIGRLSKMERLVVEADVEAGGAVNARRLARQLETTERAIYAARARAREKLARWLLPSAGS